MIHDRVCQRCHLILSPNSSSLSKNCAGYCAGLEEESSYLHMLVPRSFTDFYLKREKKTPIIFWKCSSSDSDNALWKKYICIYIYAIRFWHWFPLAIQRLDPEQKNQGLKTACIKYGHARHLPSPSHYSSGCSWQ